MMALYTSPSAKGKIIMALFSDSDSVVPLALFYKFINTGVALTSKEPLVKTGFLFFATNFPRPQPCLQVIVFLVGVRN